MEFDYAESSVLKKLGIDIISEDRNYWLVRTNAGQYFDDFYFDEYIGIEWDEIIDTEILSLDDMKEKVIERYPEESHPGYIAGQIFKFVHAFKKGDIIIIPNKDSKRFVFGTLLEDDIYIEENDPIDTLIFAECEDQKKFLKKRRKVQWIKEVNRNSLDTHLQTFIYAHNTIVDLQSYAAFIDRTLSDFYIKGDEAFYTMRVNKTKDIPFDDLADLFVCNKMTCEFINKYLHESLKIDRGELIYKIDVQSKGPTQLSGPIKKIVVFGTIMMFICGGSIKINLSDGFEVSSGGLISVINCAVNAYDTIETHRENDEQSEMALDYEKLQEQYKKCQEQLQLSAPTINDVEIEIETSVDQQP